MVTITNFFNDLTLVYGEPILKSAVVIFLSIIFYTIFNRALIKAATEGYLDYHLRIIFSNIVKWLLVAIAALFTLGFFGGSVAALWAGLSGILALIALGFVAVWSVLSNVLCSILLVIFSPFRIGDDIEIQEPTANVAVKGKVISIDMFMTTLECTHEPKPEKIDAEKPASVKKSTKEPVVAKKTTDAPVVDMGTFTMTVPNNIFFQKFIRRFPRRGAKSIRNYMASNQAKKVASTPEK